MTLKGSVKQVVWADRIKKDRLKVWGAESLFAEVEVVNNTAKNISLNYQHRFLRPFYTHDSKYCF